MSVSSIKLSVAGLFLLGVVLMVAAAPASATGNYKLGVQSGTISDVYAAESLANAEVSGFDTIDLAIEALKQGDVDFVLGDLPILKFYQADSDGLSIAGSFSEEDFGIGVAPGESDLLAAINVALGEIIDSGEYDTIFAANFGDEIVVLTDDTVAETATAYPAEPTGKLADVLTAESLVFGTDPYYPPFESYDADNNVVGFDADIAAAIGAKIAAAYNQSLNVTMKEKTWDELLAFGYDDYDATLAAMTKTAQRAENTDFSRAYYSSKQGILASADSPTISGVADLNKSADPEPIAEEEDLGACSFESFMNNIYVQSPSLSGPVVEEYMLPEVGKGSYHFVLEDNIYISWETTDLSGINLDNGLPLPSKKSFTETTFDYENRIFTGKIDFTLEGGTYGGSASWDYQMIFSEDYVSIIGGQIYWIDSGDKIFFTWIFGEDENYPYCALCNLTATDYYSENPFNNTTSPDNQTVTPSDGDSSDSGRLTLPFSGNPLAYGAIISILGLLGAGFAAMSARQSIPRLIGELQGLVDAGISDPELNSALEDLENMDGLGFFSNDRTNAIRILDNYNEMTDQALGSMRQLDELQGVVDELQAAGVSSPELEAEIAEIESMLNSQVEGDTNKDFSTNLFESFRKNKGGG